MENSVTTWSRIPDPCYVHSSPNLQESLSHVLAWEVVMGAGLLDSKCSKKTAFYKVLLNSAGSAVSFRYVVRTLFNLFIKHSKKFYLRSCHLHPDLAERDWFCSIATAVTRSDWRGSLGQRSLFILILWQYRVLLMLCIWDIRLFDGWNAITWVFSLVVLWTAFQGVLGNIWSVSIFFSMGTGTDLWACS